MSIWMLNLGFRTDGDTLTNGRFVRPPATVDPSAPVLSYSQVWLKYSGLGNPPTWLQDGVTILNGANSINPGEWTYQQNADITPLPAVVGDFLVIRFFPASASAGGTLKCTVVFGRGVQGPTPQHPLSRQSPLQKLHPPAMPRSVIDHAGDPTTWDTSSGSVPGWAWCLGKFYADTNLDPNADAHYSFNAGAAFCPAPAAPSPMVYMYGHDPTVVVKGSGGHKP